MQLHQDTPLYPYVIYSGQLFAYIKVIELILVAANA